MRKRRNFMMILHSLVVIKSIILKLKILHQYRSHVGHKNRYEILNFNKLLKKFSFQKIEFKIFVKLKKN